MQDIPRDIRSVDDIKDDWAPGPLDVTYESVVETVRAHAAEVDAADPNWIHIMGGGVDIELSINSVEAPLMDFSFHDRSPEPDSGRRFMNAVLTELGLRAFDPTGSESGLFEFTDRP